MNLPEEKISKVEGHDSLGNCKWVPKTSIKPKMFQQIQPLVRATLIGSLLSLNADAQFTAIEPQKSGPFIRPFDLSADGSVLVGQWDGNGDSAFHWKEDGGYSLIQKLGSNGYASGVSADGRVMVGVEFANGSSFPFRWTASGGKMPLDPAFAENYAFAAVDAISADGQVVVGRAGSAFYNTRPYRWTQDTGIVFLGYDSSASLGSYDGMGVSEEGNVIVGNAKWVGGSYPFRWTIEKGMEALYVLPGWVDGTTVAGLSSDGTTVIGQVNNPNLGHRGVIWNEKTGSIYLADLPGGINHSVATSVSEDGEIAVGSSYSQRGQEAIRWTQEKGTHRVADWLADSGHKVRDDMVLARALLVSDNGRVVVGEDHFFEGVNPEHLGSWLARGRSGVITLDEFTESFGTTASIPQVTNTLPSTILNGSHHRVLLLQPQLDNENAFWANGDFAHHGRRDADLSIGEAGFAHDLAQGLRGGIGLGWGHLNQDLTLGGRHELDGQYLVAELDWNIEGTPVILSATGVYGDWDADIKRGYLNGGLPDQSRGSTDLETLSVRLRADWQDLFKLYGVKFSPYLSYTLTRIESDAYAESGGGFPAAFNSQTHTTEEIRLGLTGETNISDKTKLRGIFEAVYRIDDDSAGFSGQVIGLFGFSIPGAKNNQEWLRIGAEIEHQIDENKIITATVFGSTRGEDPEISTAVNFKINF